MTRSCGTECSNRESHSSRSRSAPTCWRARSVRYSTRHDHRLRPGRKMKPSRKRGRSGREKILIIEDDPVARADLEARLEASGYSVARAADAASALTVVNREQPDLILLDLGLPAGDGFLVLERLRKIKSLAAIPVLVITGRS